MSERIVHGLFDVDFYKLTMGQFIFDYYPDVVVRWRFTNRTGIPFAHFIKLEDLRVALEAVREERFDRKIIAWLAQSEYTRGMFSPEFLRFLYNFRLPALTKIEVSEDGRDFDIESEARWGESSFWELPVMMVMIHLLTKAMEADDPRTEAEIWAEGDERLVEKIALLKLHPGLKFVDFGTRRRRHFEWQRHVLETLIAEVPGQLLGTSNVRLAYKLDLKPVGTFAHELPMTLMGLFAHHDDELGYFASQELVFEEWHRAHGDPLSIMLTDTYGTPSVLGNRNLTEAIKRWRGTRQDSGDPNEYAAMWVKWYRAHGVDPLEKAIVFSDGLNAKKMIALYERWSPEIQVLFGWGTNLMNDLGFGGLSIVMKVVAVLVDGQWIDVGKLTDNRAKAIGTPECINRMTRLADYTATFEETCRY
jgi:nicotinate phosphoribosyltransferase